MQFDSQARSMIVYDMYVVRVAVSFPTRPNAFFRLILRLFRRSAYVAGKHQVAQIDQR